MFGSSALSNHGCNSDYELWDLSGGYEMYCDSTYENTPKNPLHYHKDITNIVEVVSDDGKYTTVKTVEDSLIYLSIPNKIIRHSHGRVYCHEKIFYSIFKK